ncbi:MAG: tRNA pseudouridine(54/55) synthase Pus10 [Candidatus Poseidonia sp.]|nr:tRNA pseudouridine(54/55) synthase Pus10 [Poseidonia sp.]MBL6748436.1 tRNA pseudouridine(54/55) synthase Pus10 [Poseidonia sp.]MBL6807231.1 tRNA pseudouridine(54/55) synthase Pus10 [Poseidonia sp.]MBL6886274.1 tRNA pseudouridine(54/55) synthase Pus10 [Poseidonia sp.]MBL6893102.1 tRNA pseudouridine(54/55) synthase Pus10 [Poseidonia sp.]
MTENEAEQPDDEEEDWMKYATASFGETDYSLWDDVEEEEEETSPEDTSSQLGQLGTHMEEIPRAPSPAGHKHLIRMGTCDSCLGRIGGKMRYGQTILESGIEVRASVVDRDPHLANAREETPLCPFCENLFEEIDLLADIIFDSLEPYELSRLQLGARFPKDQIEQEEVLRKRFAAGGSDALKPSLVNHIARRLSDRLDGINMVSDKPDVLALIDVLTLTVDLDIRAVYVYGRYRKLERGIPQTRWPCRACKGRGCERCDHTGLQYKRSVQDLVGNPMLEIFEGEEHAFHGMGREDIDVRCLGRGRPFVLEVKEPKKRNFNAAKLAELINDAANGAVEVSAMRQSTRSEVVRIKDTPAEKSYTIRFTLEPMNEAEYAVLTAPVDLTKDDVQKRSTKKRRPQRRGDKESDRTKPLEAVIEVPPSGPSEAELTGMKKAELVALAEEHELKKTGTKAELIERILAALPPAPATFDFMGDEEILKILESFNGMKLAQRTPERVSHRRADLIRKRTVYEAHSAMIEVNEHGEREIEFTLRCESGTYVKETVHGDSGRTQPSVAALLKAKCKVMWLDVGDIHAD